MKSFHQVTSIVMPLDMDNVDTDMIIPAQFLTKVDRKGYGEHVFQRLREQDTHFVWHDVRYCGAEILLTRANFGCGSSREHAVWALQQAGIQVVIAESYSDIFYNNAVKNGLLVISLSATEIEALMQKAKQSVMAVAIDLLSQTMVVGTENPIHFDYDPFRKACLLKGQDDLDYLLEATHG
ncbi:MAG: 3-isopropylmalate dehydratase small subunit [Gammaproteobacteria bacterium RIFCSPHIGHO2_12_FULL_45_9]|nr:MAG: 3-isopropylmalate dehydratase small subunit [Gammaproteobacteria bacterium RIFCSPHIGHO2_12_FULL_45_9]